MEDRREQSEQSSEHVKFCKYDYWVDSDIVISFRRINHTALKKPFALIFCLPATEHLVTNSMTPPHKIFMNSNIDSRNREPIIIDKTGSHWSEVGRVTMPSMIANEVPP
jgi:hypothetical protein